jgi:hypothetical protein
MFQTNALEEIKTHFVFSKFFFPENRAVYEIMQKNKVELDRPKMILRMPIAHCIPKATNTHSEYVTLIALPMQQWLHERTSVLLYTYIVCLVILDFLQLLVCCTRSVLFYILCYA